MEAINVLSSDGGDTATTSEIDVNSPISIVQIALPNQSVQVASVTEGDTDDEVDGLAKKRREILARRPSYRKILNELSSDQVNVAKVEEDSNPSDSEGNEAATALGSGVQFQTAGILKGGTIALLGMDVMLDAMQAWRPHAAQS